MQRPTRCVYFTLKLSLTRLHSGSTKTNTNCPPATLFFTLHQLQDRIPFIKYGRFSVRTSVEIHLSATYWTKPFITTDMCKEDVIKLCMSSNSAIHLFICLVTVTRFLPFPISLTYLFLPFYTGSFNFLRKESVWKRQKHQRTSFFMIFNEELSMTSFFIASHHLLVERAALTCSANLRSLTWSPHFGCESESTK